MHHTLDGIATSMEAHRGTVFKGREIDHVLSATRSRIHALTARLDQRRSDGLVRQCHGDLHLRNICLLDGKPVAFDCIEFNQDFAQIDILYDLAFLLMDLRHAGYSREASTVLNAWLEQTNDLGGLVLLPLFPVPAGPDPGPCYRQYGRLPSGSGPPAQRGPAIPAGGGTVSSAVLSAGGGGRRIVRVG